MAMKGVLVVLLLLAPTAAADPLDLDRLLRFFSGEAEPAVEPVPAPVPVPVVEPTVEAQAAPTVEVTVVVPPDLSGTLGVPAPAFACEQHGLQISIQEQSRHLTGVILSWDWDFGDGSSFTALTRSENPTEHTYAAPGTYVVTLTVMDHMGILASASQVCLGGGLDEADAAPPPAPAPAAAAASPAPAPARAPAAACPYPLLADGSCPAVAPQVAPVPAVAAPAAQPSVVIVPAAVPTPHDAAPEAPAAVVVAATSVLALAAVGGASQVWPWLRRLLPVALFTRIKQDDLLEHPVRNQIVQLVEAQPGIHFQAIARTLERGNGVLEHHLRMLTHAGLVRERASPGYTCYFPARMDRRLMDMHAVLKSDVARSVLEQVLRQPGRTISDVAGAVGVTPKAVTYHLSRFADAGLVSLERQGRSVLAFANPLAHEATVTPVAA